MLRRWSHRRDERGAVAVLVALMMTFVLVGSAAIAVDLGMERVARRDMQAVADVVSVDLSRLIDGRSRSEIERDPRWETVRRASVDRNDDRALGEGLTVTAVLGRYDPTQAGCIAHPYEKPCFDSTIAGTVTPNAVMVTASARVAHLFGKVLTDSEFGTLTRRAVATNQRTACFKLGSYTGAVKSGDASLLAPLNGLLGLNLRLLDYQAIANADLSVADLIATGTLGTPDQLLTGTVTKGQLLKAAVQALGADTDAGGTGTVNVREQNRLAAIALQQVINTSTNLTGPVKLGDLVNIDPNNQAGLTTDVDLLDLVAGSIVVANGDAAVAIPTLSAGSATVGKPQTSLKVVERVRLACGTIDQAPTIDRCQTAVAPFPRACTRNAQVTGTLTLPLTVTPPATTLQVLSAHSDLVVDLGNAAGVLYAPEPTCKAGTTISPDTLTVRVGTSAATTRLVTTITSRRLLSVEIAGSAAVKVGGVVVTPAVPARTIRVVIEFDVASEARLDNPRSSSDVALQIPPNDTTPASRGAKHAALGAPQPGVQSNVRVLVDNNGDGVGDVALSTLGTTVEALVNAQVGPALTTATKQVTDVTLPDIMNPLTRDVNNLLIGPLATLLGLDVAGADVYAEARPTCQTPKLVG